MEEAGTSIVEAKKHYTQQLIDMLTNYIYQGLKSIMEKCKDEKKVLKTFQEKLCSIPKWNQDIIDNEYIRITQEIEPEFIDNLIEAVFISNVKVLSTIRAGKNKPINIQIPESKIFIHKCYIECARYFFQDPHLIDDRETHLSRSEIARNIKRANLAINICIEKTIRDLIPIQKILENYLDDLNCDDDNDKQGGGGDGESNSSKGDNNENHGNENESYHSENRHHDESYENQGNSGYSGNREDNGNVGNREDNGNVGNREDNKDDDFFQHDQEEDATPNERDDLDYNESELFSKNPNLDVTPGSTIQDTPSSNVFQNNEIKNIIIPRNRHSSFEPQTANNEDPPFFSDDDD
ncbi:MAG: hypothetical protein EHM20_14810 [Alphaproteobacteria bacterium]|nr:MAG: hypothetical protein EHM20_14810 [Alphaproteobacteria bacterium]